MFNKKTAFLCVAAAVMGLTAPAVHATPIQGSFTADVSAVTMDTEISFSTASNGYGTSAATPEPFSHLVGISGTFAYDTTTAPTFPPSSHSASYHATGFSLTVNLSGGSPIIADVVGPDIAIRNYPAGGFGDSFNLIGNHDQPGISLANATPQTLTLDLLALDDFATVFDLPDVNEAVVRLTESASFQVRDPRFGSAARTLALDVRDTTSTAFDSLVLPDGLNLADFDSPEIELAFLTELTISVDASDYTSQSDYEQVRDFFADPSNFPEGLGIVVESITRVTVPIDSLVTTVAPEPATGLLALLGLGAMMLRRRRPV